MALSRGALWFIPASRVRRARRPFATIRGRKPEPGDFVIAECPWEDDTARLVEVLGGEDEPSWDNLAVLSRFRWPQQFSRQALHEAAAARPPGGASRGRVDFQDRITFTMDPVDAADFDDALSWRRLAHGRMEVGIHIADVSHYVKPGSALDREAQERATSVYLSGEAVPMLPERLSSDLCSLRPGELRFALSVIAEMDDDGGVHASRIVQSCIRSRARLSYEEGEMILAGAPGPRADVRKALLHLAAISEKLTEKRSKRGGLDLDTSEVRAEVDKDGNTLALDRKERLTSHRIVEEFMLLANAIVAEEAERRQAPFLFRVHDPPAKGDLERLGIQLKALGLPQASAQGKVSHNLQRLLDYSLPDEKKKLVHQLVLRSLQRAEYREKLSPHFGLALQSYTHFTSPIRRYPDLFNHRQITRWLHPRSAASAKKEPLSVAALAGHTSAQEQAAQNAERESLRVKSLRFMEEYLGDEFAGTVTGLVSRGFFVELDSPPVDGFCRVGDFIDDEFRLDASRVRLVGRRTRRRFTLGDRVRVAVARIDIPARELELSLVSPRPRHQTGKSKRRKKKKLQRRKGGRK